MKKFLFLSVVIAAVATQFSCSKDDVVNSITTITRGAIVLYEGTGSPGSGDYAFINFDNDSVANDIFSNSNNGATLAAFPDGILLHGQSMYVCAQGNFGSQGRMYKINTTDNKLVDTVSFGVNPYSMALAQNHLWVTNTSGESVTKLDLELNVISTISVGQNPADIIQAIGDLWVAKKSYTTEYSVAIINSLSNDVTKVFFNTPPVSVSYSGTLVYVSTYSGKMLYALDTAVIGSKLDSIPVSINEPAIGDIVAANINTLYVLGVNDTMFSSNIGSAVYKVDLANKIVNPVPIITAAPGGDIYGISYDYVNDRIYITDSKNGSSGQVRIYNPDGNLLKTYIISGSFPKRVIIKYENQ